MRWIWGIIQLCPPLGAGCLQSVQKGRILEITWYGQSCFRITETGHTSCITDPCLPPADQPRQKLRANLVAVSRTDPAHSAVEQVSGCDYVIKGAGEYEVGELFVTGLPMHEYDAEREAVIENVAYFFEYPNGLTVLHLGSPVRPPEQALMEQLGAVTVLLLPVGDGPGLNAEQAADVIALVEPSYVVPIEGGAAPGAVERFLKARGISQLEPLDSLRVSNSNLPEQTRVALLHPKRG